MKTAFYILASLSLGAFSAQAATLWTTTFGNAAQQDPAKVTLTNSGGEMGGITGSVHSLQKTTYSNGQTEDLVLMTGGGVCSDASLFTPGVNVQSSGSWTAGMTFTNGSDQGCSISAVKMTVVSFNSAGAAQPNQRSFSLTVTIDGQEVTANVNLAANSGKNGTAATLTFGTPIELKAGQSLDFSVLACKANQTDGSFFGIKSMEFQGELLVPEPATASLGLLGLAVLMMRRRRA